MLLPKSAFALIPLAVLSLSSWAVAENRFTRWWSSDEDNPPGVREEIHSGRKWPLEPRPTGPKEPYVQQYHDVHYWPDPYRWHDRNSVRTLLTAQQNNGWITATTLYEQHFDHETQEINEAGRVYLRWILLHAPPERRMAWVATGNTMQITQRRMESVQAEAVNITGGDTPLIYPRVCLPVYNSAADVDMIRRSYLGSIPAPRIPYVPLNGGSSGGGSSGAPAGGGTGSR